MPPTSTLDAIELVLLLLRQIGRSDIDRLLEERPIQWIRLVEDGEDAKASFDEQAFESHLAARNEVLHQDALSPISGAEGDFRLSKKRGDATKRGRELDTATEVTRGVSCSVVILKHPEPGECSAQTETEPQQDEDLQG